MKSLKTVFLSSFFFFAMGAKAEIMSPIGVSQPIGVPQLGMPIQPIRNVPSPCLTGCGVRQTTVVSVRVAAVPNYNYGYGTHGIYGQPYGYGVQPYYGYGYGYGYYNGSCGKCHRSFTWVQGRRRCGCNGRKSFALAINTPSFGFGLQIF